MFVGLLKVIFNDFKGDLLSIRAECRIIKGDRLKILKNQFECYVIL